MALTGQAAILTAPGRVEVRQVDFPDPREGEILVRTQAAAICGSDVHRVYGQTRFFREIGDYDYPCPPGYPGHEGIGEVWESRSPRFAPGDLVLTVPDNSCNRTFAGFQVIPERFALPVPQPDDRPMAPLHLLMAQQLGTVIYAMRRFWPSGDPGETAVVVGTGSAGLFFVQLLRLLGFDRVIACDLEPDRLDVARSAGADEAVLAPGEQVQEATGTRGADLAIDASGTDTGRVAAMNAVAPDGRVGFYGLPEGPELTIPYATLFRRQATLAAAVGAQQEPGARSFAEALRLISDGAIPVSGHVTHTFALPRIAQAFALAHDRRDGVVKVGIIVD